MKTNRSRTVTRSCKLRVLSAYKGPTKRSARGDAVPNAPGSDAADLMPIAAALAELNDGDPPGSALSSAAGRSDFRNCARGQRHSGFIDYILLGESLFKRRVPDSVERLVWTTDDAAHRILSDHCPLAVRIGM